MHRLHLHVQLCAQGTGGDEELMRFALCYNILQVSCIAVVCVNVRSDVRIITCGQQLAMARSLQNCKGMCYNILQVHGGGIPHVHMLSGISTYAAVQLFAEGLEEHEELMRFALCYNILQVGARYYVSSACACAACCSQFGGRQRGHALCCSCYCCLPASKPAA
jgi:hypothetical protein